MELNSGGDKECKPAFRMSSCFLLQLFAFLFSLFFLRFQFALMKFWCKTSLLFVSSVRLSRTPLPENELKVELPVHRMVLFPLIVQAIPVQSGPSQPSDTGRNRRPKMLLERFSVRMHLDPRVRLSNPRGMPRRIQERGLQSNFHSFQFSSIQRANVQIGVLQSDFEERKSLFLPSFFQVWQRTELSAEFSAQIELSIWNYFLVSLNLDFSISLNFIYKDEHLWPNKESILTLESWFFTLLFAIVTLVIVRRWTSQMPIQWNGIIYWPRFIFITLNVFLQKVGFIQDPQPNHSQRMDVGKRFSASFLFKWKPFFKL